MNSSATLQHLKVSPHPKYERDFIIAMLGKGSAEGESNCGCGTYYLRVKTRIVAEVGHGLVKVVDVDLAVRL